MERPMPPEEPIPKIELGIERPEFEKLLARRQRLINGYGAPDAEVGEAELFDVMIQLLPETDPELAVAAYEALATQGTGDLKEVIAVRIDLLFPVDKEAAMRVATGLIRSE